MKAVLKNYRQAPRKVRLVANLIRGKEVSRAITMLSFLPKKAALPMQKLLKSAEANAKAQGLQSIGTLKVSKITVNKGLTFVRQLPRARGRATPLHKHTSHIVLELSESAKK